MVKQGEIGRALIGAFVKLSAKQPQGDKFLRGLASGAVGDKDNPFEISLFPWGTSKPDKEVQRTFVHEGAHGTAADSQLRREFGPEFERAHQVPYRAMSQGVVDDE